MKRHHLTIYTDGGARGNPGPAAYGFTISDEASNLIYEEGKTIGNTTNNVAEYTGILKALTWVLENISNPASVSCFLDSELVVKQLTGVYKIKNEELRNYVYSVKQIEEKLGVPISYTAIPRAQNKLADKLVNQALDQQ